MKSKMSGVVPHGKSKFIVVTSGLSKVDEIYSVFSSSKRKGLSSTIAESFSSSSSVYALVRGEILT